MIFLGQCARSIQFSKFCTGNYPDVAYPIVLINPHNYVPARCVEILVPDLQVIGLLDVYVKVLAGKPWLRLFKGSWYRRTNRLAYFSLDDF